MTKRLLGCGKSRVLRHHPVRTLLQGSKTPVREVLSRRSREPVDVLAMREEVLVALRHLRSLMQLQAVLLLLRGVAAAAKVSPKPRVLQAVACCLRHIRRRLPREAREAQK